MAMNRLVAWVESILDDFAHLRASAREVAGTPRLSGVWTYPIRLAD